MVAFNIKVKGSIEEKLNWTFNTYDRDHNGSIDRKELKKMFEILFTILDVDLKDEKYNLDKRSKEVMKRFDLSGDKKLSREEFVQGIKDDEPLRNLLLNHKFE